MKITHVSIDNILGVIQVDVALTTPVVAFCGPNGAGKSSVREAIRAALLGMPERVLKKKDLGMLVHDDAKGGSVAVEGVGLRASFTAPKADHDIQHDLKMADWERQRLALPYCLDPAAFARAAPDERRKLLFALTGISSNKDDIIAAMHKRGLTDAVIESVAPMLHAGFHAAEKFAEERCRDAKASWKAITGETYGPVKAEGWAAPAAVAAVDEAAIEKLAAKVKGLRARIDAERTKLGAAEQVQKTRLAAQESREADEKAFARLQAAQDKLALDEAEMQRWAEQVQHLEQRAGTGPRVGLVHDLARAVKFLAGNYGGNLYEHADALPAYEAQYGALDAQGDPDAAAKLPEARRARDLMQRSVDNDRRDIEAAKAAGARLQQPVERGSEGEAEGIREFLRAAETEMAQASADLTRLQADQQAAADARRRTETATAAHREAQDWQAAVDALSPAGIQNDILLKGLGPVGRILDELRGILNFPGVTLLDSDIDIYAGRRPYALLSVSERWRVDAQIALALAQLSGLKLVALDEFGVLDLASRADCIAGLDALAEAGKIDTALVFGTFKKLPNFGVFPSVTGYWVKDGRVTETTTAREAAAA